MRKVYAVRIKIREHAECEQFRYDPNRKNAVVFFNMMFDKKDFFVVAYFFVDEFLELLSIVPFGKMLRMKIAGASITVRMKIGKLRPQEDFDFFNGGEQNVSQLSVKIINVNDF